MSRRVTTVKKASASLTKRSKRRADPPLQIAVRPKAWTPHAYQKRAMKFLLENAGAGLFLDPGLGKTSITYGALKVLKKADLSGVSLVVAPLRVCHSTWPGEQEKWKDFNHFRVGVLHGKHKEQVLNDAINGAKYDVLCINPEGLEWLLGVTKRRGRSGKIMVEVDAKRVRWLFGADAITDLIIDESTKFKNSSSQRFKMLRNVLGQFRRRWILTGTPSPNGLLDLFGQMYIVDMGASLGQYITHYRMEYFMQTGFGGYTWVPQKNAEKRIYAKLKKNTLRLDAKDYLELPKVVMNPIRFDLPDSARELYDELEEEFTAEFEGNTITALNAGSAISKCAQVANGGLYKQQSALIAGKRKHGTGSWMKVHSAKDEIVQELVEELNGQPVLVAYEFNHDLERLLGVFGKNTPYIGAGVSAKRGKEVEDSWNRGELSVLPVQPASAAHGLNLQHASSAEVGHVIFYGPIYDYENFDQLIRRVARQGSKHKKVIVHLIIARDTVDEAKWVALNRKKKGQDNLLDALRVYVRSRKK